MACMKNGSTMVGSGSLVVFVHGSWTSCPFSSRASSRGGVVVGGRRVKWDMTRSVQCGHWEASGSNGQGGPSLSCLYVGLQHRQSGLVLHSSSGMMVVLSGSGLRCHFCYIFHFDGLHLASGQPLKPRKTWVLIPFKKEKHIFL